MARTIRNIRLKDYDYSSDGFYYITISSNYKKEFSLSEREKILKYCSCPFMGIQGVKLDYYELMKNHLHLILILEGCKMKLGEIIRRFKAKISKEANVSLWQPNYYEHVIRNDRALNKIREYIHNNPLKEKIDFEEIYKNL